MKVLYDISILGQGHYHNSSRSGIFRVVENLGKELVVHPQCQVQLCSFGNENDMFDALDYRNATKAFATIPFAKLKNNYTKMAGHLHRMQVIRQQLTDHHLTASQRIGLKAQFQYQRVLRKFSFPQNQDYLPLPALDQADIYHTPFFPIPGAVRNSRVKSRFITCYDLIPIYRPEYCHSGVVKWIQELLDSMDRETWVVCISEATRNELLTYMGNRLDEKKVSVTELAAAASFYRSTDQQLDATVRRKYGIPDGPFVLSLCTLEPRKNIEKAIEAFVLLVQQQHLTDLSLVLVGHAGFKGRDIIDGIAYEETIKRKIIITGFVADADLAPLYSEATMFVYPSFYEGFGLPPLEAMQCGTPVITSNTTSLPEVVGNAGIMIDPGDTTAICAAMWEVYSKPTLQQQLAESGVERAKQFSWKKCADKTVEAYQQSLVK